MRRLRRLFNRARLDERELNMMRGILTALAPGSGRPPEETGDADVEPTGQSGGTG